MGQDPDTLQIFFCFLFNRKKMWREKGRVGNCCLMGTEFQSGKMKKFDGGDGYTKMSMDLMSKKCTLINGYSGKGCVMYILPQ